MPALIWAACFDMELEPDDLEEELLEEEEEDGRANSIVIVDYVENGSVVPAVINSNRRTD